MDQMNKKLAALQAAFSTAMQAVAAGYPQGYNVDAHVVAQFGSAAAEWLCGDDVHTGPDLCAALGHCTLERWVEEWIEPAFDY
jgi:hypothetical protein